MADLWSVYQWEFVFLIKSKFYEVILNERTCRLCRSISRVIIGSQVDGKLVCQASVPILTGGKGCSALGIGIGIGIVVRSKVGSPGVALLLRGAVSSVSIGCLNFFTI